MRTLPVSASTLHTFSLLEKYRTVPSPIEGFAGEMRNAGDPYCFESGVTDSNEIVRSRGTVIGGAKVVVVEVVEVVVVVVVVLVVVDGSGTVVVVVVVVVEVVVVLVDESNVGATARVGNCKVESIGVSKFPVGSVFFVPDGTRLSIKFLSNFTPVMFSSIDVQEPSVVCVKIVLIASP